MVVYKITNRVNGKIYIGKWQGKSVERRWQIHCQTAQSGRGFYLHNAIRKYGVEVFTIEVLATANTKEELSALERSLILEYKAVDPQIGYNLAKGGEGGFSYTGERNPFYGKHHTEKTKAVLREKCPRIGWKHSAETRSKISRAHTGKKFTAEHRQRISQSKQGTVISLTTRQKMSATLKKTPRSAEWRANISAALKGKTKSEAHRQALSASRRKGFGR
jgi:group I intron endonuclease